MGHKMIAKTTVLLLLPSIMLICFPSYTLAQYHPVIFLGGNQGSNSDSFHSWQTWNSDVYSTAMKKIIDEHYKGYTAG